jgi:O-antigen ligase
LNFNKFNWPKFLTFAVKAFENSQVILRMTISVAFQSAEGRNANWRFCGRKNMSSNWTGWSIGEIRLIGEISGHYLRSTGEKIRPQKWNPTERQKR